MELHKIKSHLDKLFDNGNCLFDIVYKFSGETIVWEGYTIRRFSHVDKTRSYRVHLKHGFFTLLIYHSKDNTTTYVYDPKFEMFLQMVVKVLTLYETQSPTLQEIINTIEVIGQQGELK